MKYALLIIILCSNIAVQAQQKEHISRVDSLKEAMELSSNDSSTLNILYDLTDEGGIGNLTKTKRWHYTKRMLTLAKKLNNKQDVANAYTQMGFLYSDNRQYHKALRYHIRALFIRKEINDSIAIAASINNIGICYSGMKERDTAMLLYKQAEGILTRSNSTAKKRNKFLANVLINEGIDNFKQNRYAEAIKSFEDAMKISNDASDVVGKVNCYVNEGYIFIQQKRYDDAIEFESKALTLATETNYNKGINASNANLKLAAKMKKKSKA